METTEELEFRARERAIVHAKHFGDKTNISEFWRQAHLIENFLLGKGLEEALPLSEEKAKPYYREGDTVYLISTGDKYIVKIPNTSKGTGSPYKVGIANLIQPKGGKDDIRELDISEVKIAGLREEEN